MDKKSHILFGEILLEKANGNTDLKEWATSPDIDLPFLHRYYRHRFSVINKTYKEFYQIYSASKRLVKQPTSDIALCIASHMYLDIFNGWVFPFGIWYLIRPQKTVLDEVLDDFNKPKLLVKELIRLSAVIGDSFSQQFYRQNEQIMRETIPNECSSQMLTYAFVERLSVIASDNKSVQRHLIDRTCIQMLKFTGQKIVDGGIDLLPFEREYAKLIVQAIEE